MSRYMIPSCIVWGDVVDVKTFCQSIVVVVVYFWATVIDWGIIVKRSQIHCHDRVDDNWQDDDASCRTS